MAKMTPATRRKRRSRHSARGKLAKRHLASLAGGLFFFVLAAIGVQSEYGRHRTVVASAPQGVPVAIFADCQMTNLPVSLLPETTLHVLGLNPRFMASQHWGLTDIPNLTAKVTQWPSQQIMEAEWRTREANKNYSSAGEFGYRCDISNHTGVSVLNMAMPITFWYGEHPKDALKYTVVVRTLNRNSRFTFYMFNDSTANVEGYLPSSVGVTVAGESSRRTVPLHFPDRSPVQSFLMFSPSQFQWGPAVTF